jgi:hypothetical protein
MKKKNTLCNTLQKLQICITDNEVLTSLYGEKRGRIKIHSTLTVTNNITRPRRLKINSERRICSQNSHASNKKPEP